MYYIYSLYFKNGLVMGSRVDDQFPPRIGETIILQYFKNPYDEESRTVIFIVEKIEHNFDFNEGYTKFDVLNVKAKEVRDEIEIPKVEDGDTRIFATINGVHIIVDVPTQFVEEIKTNNDTITKEMVEKIKDYQEKREEKSKNV
jgi:hypothetical protein